jgi:hypothetical protein
MTQSGFLPSGDLNLLLLCHFYARRARRAARSSANLLETTCATHHIHQKRCATEQIRLRNGKYSLNALRTKTPIPCATANTP